MGTYDCKLASQTMTNLRIIDDLRLKPMRSGQDEDFHDIIAERYERRTTIITSNLDTQNGTTPSTTNCWAPPDSTGSCTAPIKVVRVKFSHFYWLHYAAANRSSIRMLINRTIDSLCCPYYGTHDKGVAIDGHPKHIVEKYY